MRQYLDTRLGGIILGLLGPIPGFLGYYLIYWTHKTPLELLQMVLSNDSIQGAVLGLSLLGNLGLFLILFRLKWDHGARGILTVTFFYVPLMIYLVFLR